MRGAGGCAEFLAKIAPPGTTASTALQSPHDSLFHSAFRFARHANAWLQSIVPVAIGANVDWQKMQPAGERLPGNRLRSHFADLIFRVPYRHQAGYLWLVVEHKSHQDPGLDWQLIQYVVHLRRNLERRRQAAPHIVTVVLHHGRDAFARRSTKARDELTQSIEALQVHLPYLVDDLTQQDEQHLRNRSLTPLATLVLLCLRVLAKLPAAEVCSAIERWCDLLVAVDRDEGPPIGSHAIDAIGYYALAVSEVPALALSEIFSRILDRPENTIMSTLERTYQKGKTEGMAKGRADTILRMLELRFATVSDEIRQQVRAGDSEQLARWTDLVLTVARAEDILAG